MFAGGSCLCCHHLDPGVLSSLPTKVSHNFYIGQVNNSKKKVLSKNFSGAENVILLSETTVLLRNFYLFRYFYLFVEPSIFSTKLLSSPQLRHLLLDGKCHRVC